jgi:hypothetical protein
MAAAGLGSGAACGRHAPHAAIVQAWIFFKARALAVPIPIACVPMSSIRALFHPITFETAWWTAWYSIQSSFRPNRSRGRGTGPCLSKQVARMSEAKSGVAFGLSRVPGHCKSRTGRADERVACFKMMAMAVVSQFDCGVGFQSLRSRNAPAIRSPMPEANRRQASSHCWRELAPCECAQR